ncbi:MAG: ornithine cyclodeaminase family protein [Anaerolineales bacterium]
MLILNKDDVQKALPMREMIAATKDAFAALSAGNAVVPQRIHLSIPAHQGVSLFMPAYFRNESFEALTVKTASVFANNTERDLPLIHAVVLVLEADTGRPLALLEGGSLTAIRTGAASGAATDLLARKNSKVAAIFGAGVQSRTQLEAVCTVRHIEKVFVFDPQPEVVRSFIDEMAGSEPVPEDIQSAEDPQEAVAQADVICCATTSKSPVFQDQHLQSGVHLNGVGAYTPDMQEIPPQTVLRAYLVVDSRASVLHEAGDIIQPIQAGLFDENHIQAEIGEIAMGEKAGRTNEQQITFFKSVGVAVQDAAAAHLALDNALKMGLGQEVQL